LSPIIVDDFEKAWSVPYWQVDNAIEKQSDNSEICEQVTIDVTSELGIIVKTSEDVDRVIQCAYVLLPDEFKENYIETVCKMRVLKEYPTRLRLRAARKRPNLKMIKIAFMAFRDTLRYDLPIVMVKNWNFLWHRSWIILQYGLKRGFRNMLLRFGLPYYMKLLIETLYMRCMIPCKIIEENGKLFLVNERGKRYVTYTRMLFSNKKLNDIWSCVIAQVDPQFYGTMSLVSKSFYNEITPYCEVRVDDDDEINKYYKLRCKHFQGVEVDDDDCPDCYNERKESILAEYSFEIDYLFAMIPDMFMFEAEVVWLAKRVKKMTILEREGFESVLRILSAKKNTDYIVYDFFVFVFSWI
jgi:hypothetical protein